MTDQAQNNNYSKPVFQFIAKGFPFSLYLAPIIISLLIAKYYDIALLLFIIVLTETALCFLRQRKINIRHKRSQELTKIPDDIELLIDQSHVATAFTNKIFSNNNKLNILVGSSGSGKSTLINFFLKKHLKQIGKLEGKKIHQLVINSYDDIDIEILKLLKINHLTIPSESSSFDALKKVQQNDNVLIILDQFEKIFLLSKSDAIFQLMFLCKLFNYCNNVNNNDNIYCLISMRKEWFFNLKFFEDYVPEIKNILVLEGFDAGSDIEERQIKNKLRLLIRGYPELLNTVINYCSHDNLRNTYYVLNCQDVIRKENKNFDFTERIILPIELITVSKSLFISIEYKGENPNGIKSIDKKHRIKKYFDFLLGSYPQPNDAKKVFYALSVSPNTIRGLNTEELCKITTLPFSRVIDVLSHQKYDGNVYPLTRIGSKYDWKHDFFAEQFNIFSGEIIDPIDRDNINFFWHNKDRISNIGASIKSKASQKLGFIVFGVSFLILFLRLIYPIFSKHIASLKFFGFFSLPIFESEIASRIFTSIDISFLPIFIALSLWSWYVTSVFRKILINLNENKLKLRKVFSYFVLYWSLFCVILTIILPFLWLFFSGLGGLIVGLKYVQMTKSSKRNKTIAFDESFLKRLGKETVYHSLIMMLIGLGYAFILDPLLANWISADLLYLQVVSTIIVFIAIFYFALLSINEHTRDKNIPTYLGTYIRYRFIDDFPDDYHHPSV